jgi:hypothetical protein
MFVQMSWVILEQCSELEFLKSLWGLGTEEEEGYRTGPPGYIGWRNSFLGIDSRAPYTFKNTGSGSRPGFGASFTVTGGFLNNPTCKLFEEVFLKKVTN